MTLRLYNTLTRQVEPLVPLSPPSVTIYVCGPTVYDDPHIGHLRSAYTFDVIRRYMAFRGLRVRFVRNITDVDDKIIERARRELANSRQHTADSGELKEKCEEVAQRYTKSYHEALDRVGIEPPDAEPRAIQHIIPQMTDSISKLLMEGIAYEAGGNVYFSVRQFKQYGALSRRTLDELQAGSRAEPGEGKRDPMDFALWKAAKPNEPSWMSPWGAGRPGWHIECSTMSTHYLGDEFDIHGGGLDLIFPHHENEIAQARAAGKPFARHWLHNGLLTVNGAKMSKSLGNVVTVDEALEACEGTADILKLLFLSAHYRSPVDYTKNNLKAASGRFRSLFYLLHLASAHEEAACLPKEVPSGIADLEQQFDKAMDEDISTPNALAALDKLANYGYQCVAELDAARGKAQQTDASLKGRIVSARDALARLGGVLGLFQDFRAVKPPSKVNKLVQQREHIRQKRDFQTADRIRKEVEREGFIIADTSSGPVVLPKQ